jgi:exopolysaccharide production protein ExoQ
MRYRPNPYSNANSRARTANTLRRPATPVANPAKSRGGSMLLTLMGWIMLVSMTVPATVFTPASEQSGGAYSANTTARIIKLALLVVSALAIARNWTAAVALVKQLNRFFIVFLLLVPLSILWSISRDDTIARFVTIVSVVAVWSAVCLASWEPQRFQKLLRPVMTFLILGSIIFAITSPDLAIEIGEGTLKDAWRGLTSQKNVLGQLASFTFIFWLHAWLARQVSAWKTILFGGCSAACVLLSRSSTSLLATVFVTTFLFMLLRTPHAWRRAMPYLVASFATIVLTYALAILKLVPGLDILLRPITSFTGKDMTFSNRSVIWDIIKEHIQFSPFLGSGYGAYWIGTVPTSPSYTFVGRMYFYPNEAHNGYLEMVNDLGFVGLIVLLGYLIWYLRQALGLLRFDRNQAALYLAVFFQQAIINLSESCWLVVNAGLSFTVMTFATIALARSALDQRAGAALPSAMPSSRHGARVVARAPR